MNGQPLSPFRELPSVPEEWELELDEAPLEQHGETHATEEALAELELPGEAPEAELMEAEASLAAPFESEGGLVGRILGGAWEMAAVLADIRAGNRNDRELTSKVFFLRHPDRKGARIGAGEQALAREWKDIHAHVVLPLLLSGPFEGPMHTPPGTPLAPELRKGVPADAKLSPLSITRRGLRKAPYVQKDSIAAIVVHNTSRGPARRARESGYRYPAVHYALNYYVGGDGGFPHYVVDFNGTIYATCDERRAAHHAGWVHKGGAKLFTQHWTPPEWWSRVWWPQGAKTPINLLAKGAPSPNHRTIGIELLILPDLTYTAAQYNALARLVVDIQARNPDVRIPSAPSRGLLGHEDFAPVQADGGRADSRGGWDPGAHRPKPYFDWQRLWSEIQRVAPGFGGGGAGPAVPVRELAGEAGEGWHEPWHEADEGRDEADAWHESDLEAAAEERGWEEHDAEEYGEEEYGEEEYGEEAEGLDLPWEEAESFDLAWEEAEAPPPPALPAGPFGTLTASYPEGAPPFSYRFTPEDAVWTARFIKGEAGGRNDAENRAVIWAMFNRYALFTHPESHFGKRARLRGYPTFASFLRRYSTTLQPYLMSHGAVERSKGYARENPSRFKWVPLGGTFRDARGRDVEKGQLAHHIRLQRLPWDAPELADSRALAAAALEGRAPNPVGLASNFADTAAYFRQRHGRRPTGEEWRQFTHAHARARKPRWIWIGERVDLRQYGRNSFFVDARLSDPHQRGAQLVKVVPGG